MNQILRDSHLRGTNNKTTNTIINRFLPMLLESLRKNPAMGVQNSLKILYKSVMES